jgi:apolipoprotein N-acyltransferase
MLEARGAQSEAGVHPAGGMETYSFSTPICFEDAMPEPARMMTAPQEHGGRKADFLVNVSNDGWFHAVELDQHLQACQLRAVENRVSIARSVNTGNSGFIDSNGRIIKLVSDSNGRSIGVVGFESMVMPVDTRVTIYSRIGDLFPIVCGIVATLLTGWTFVRPRRAA